MMETILQAIGQFSENDLFLFDKQVIKRSVNRNELLLEEGKVCQSVFYILSGSCYQYQTDETEENIIDLHLEKEWMFNHTSLINQSPSKTSIKAFMQSEIIELTLDSLHRLIAKSNAFLQFCRMLNQDNIRTYCFDNALSPAQKYSYIQEAKPLIAQAFPVKMIASYLKIAPETLSRVRASY